MSAATRLVVTAITVTACGFPGVQAANTLIPSRMDSDGGQLVSDFPDEFEGPVADARKCFAAMADDKAGGTKE